MIESIQSMQKYQRILVPLDGSAFAEEALAYAAALATKDSHVLLLRVIAGERERSSPIHLFGGLTDDEVRQERRDALKYLVATANRVRITWAFVQPIASVAVGDPAEQIVRTAHDRGYELIVMARHGRGAVGRLAHGSVADRVARTSPVPVLITRPEGETRDATPRAIQRLVVPLDGSVLAEQALPVAAALAQRMWASILLVSVVNLWGDNSPTVLYPTGLSPALYDEAIRVAEGELRGMLEVHGSSLRAQGIEVSEQLLRGPVAAAIMAATEPGDAVVMTSHARSGFTRFWLGSVAEKLVRECQTPVLLVPPIASVLTTQGAVRPVTAIAQSARNEAFVVDVGLGPRSLPIMAWV